MRENTMPEKSLIRMTQALFLFNAVIWLVITIASLVRLDSNSAITPWIIAILMLGNVAAFLLSSWGVGTGQKRFLALALVVLAINILLTITDQVGFLDIATLAIDLILIGLVIGVWRRNPGNLRIKI
jgi:hypothetical protein